VKYLLDTHFLLWISENIELAPSPARLIIEDQANELYFSAASIWEIAVKCALGRSDFMVDPAKLLKGLLDNGYLELTMTSYHALALSNMPRIHKDPFDRILIAQAIAEGMTLLTVDAIVGQYPGPIRKV
jgi:PIN domain nuclease of toxin-antitoxin system